MNETTRSVQNIEGWQTYIRDIRKHLPADYEAVLNKHGLTLATQAYVLWCYVEDVLPADCAARLIMKFTPAEKDNG